MTHHAAYIIILVETAMNLKFEDLTTVTKDDIHAALLRNSPDELALVPITVALLSRDLISAQEVCLLLSVNKDPRIRGHAVISLGHLARRLRKLDEKRVIPVVEAGLLDPDEYVRAHAKSAADEIHQFLGWNFKRHMYGL